MSRAYDAKHEALAVHPKDREAACSLFLGYLDCSEDDFRYEFNQSVERYIFGDEAETSEQDGSIINK